MRSNFALLAILTAAGCNSNSVPVVKVEDRVDAAAKFDEAKAAMAKKDYSAALPALDRTIETNALRSDQRAEALEMRAQCWFDKKEYRKAADDLDAMLQSEETGPAYELRAACRKSLGDETGAAEDRSRAQALKKTR